MDRLKNKLKQLIESPYAVFLIGIGIIVIVIILFFPTISSLRKSINETEKASARIALSQIDSFLSDKKNAIEVPSRYLRENLSDSENKLILQKILREDYFTSVSLADLQGNEVLKYDKFKTMFQSDMRNLMNNVSFRNSLNTKDISWSKITLSEKFEPSITINIPVLSPNSSIMGVVSATLGVNSMFDAISGTDLPNEAKVYVVDNNGVLISDTDLSLVLKGTNFGERKIVKDTLASNGEIISSPDNKYVYINQDGIDVISAGGKVQSTGWGVIVEEPKSVAFKNITRLLVSSLVALFFVIFLIALIRKINLRVVGAREELQKNLLKQQELFKELQESKEDIEKANTHLFEKDQKLAEKVTELENFQKFIVGRELRMVELKQEIETLKKR